MIEYCLAALAPELARLDTLIDREIRRVRARYELSLDEYRGLYVSDASSIPTNLGVNPQHTIMGMAQVLAERLLDRG